MYPNVINNLVKTAAIPLLKKAMELLQSCTNSTMKMITSGALSDPIPSSSPTPVTPHPTHSPSLIHPLSTP